MVDVDRRPTGPNPAHAAGLRRLSARAASVSTPTVRNRNSLHSFSALSEKVITHLSSSGIQLHPSHGAEFARSADSDPILRKQRSVAQSHSSAPRCPVPGFSRHSLDAAVDLRRGRSKWVEGYVGMMGSVLREGGWSESEILEMVSGSGSVLFDNEEVLDALVSKAERFSDSLRKSGWSSEEVKDALGLDLRPEKKGGRPPKKVATQMVERLGKLVESVSRS